MRTGLRTEPQGFARPKSETEKGTRHSEEEKIEIGGKSGQRRVLEANEVGWSARICQMLLRWGLT